ncbi:restriction endonuclease subunit S [Nocardia terpenica]|uniref:restriction endonuclease subunit S n=1 Tax=Nocardia terpenica TaxID=455432 RepID=UPI001933FFA8|nr:restriction endonuclease subunit S [Nocardia terpenica]
MSEWKTLKLGAAISIKHGFAFKGEYFSDRGPGPILVTPGNFAIGGGFKEGKAKYYHGPTIAGYGLSPGDLIVTMTDLSKGGDTLGYPAIVPAGPQYLHNQRIGLVQIKDDSAIDQRFLSYALRTAAYRAHVLGSATGSTVRHTSPSRIEAYSLRVPRLVDQIAIGSVLGSLDDKIAVNDRIATTVRSLAMAKFSSSLMTPGVREVELSELTSVLVRGITPQYSEDSDALVVVNQKCIREGQVDLRPARRTLRGRAKAPKLLERNDVLVNSTGVGTLGRVARWTSTTEATVDSHVTIVRFDPAQVDPVLGGMALIAAQQEIEMLGEGSTGQTELSRVRLGSHRLAMPTNQTAANLRPVIDSLESRGDAAIAESAALARLRDALLPKLMSGDIKVREAERVVEEAI